MDLEGLGAGLVAFLYLLDDIGSPAADRSYPFEVSGWMLLSRTLTRKLLPVTTKENCQRRLNNETIAQALPTAYANK
jgi:hypothetical protein